MVAGCGDSDSSTDSEAAVSPSGIEIPKETIAYIEPAAVDEVTNRNVTQMKEAAKELGWELNFTNAQGDFAKVISAAESRGQRRRRRDRARLDRRKLVRQPLLNAEKAGIPAIVIGGGVEEDPLYVAQYTEDEPLMSKLLTERMVEDLNGKGKVAAMEITQLSSGVERADAREEVLEGTDVELVDSKEGDLADPVQGTKKNASALISANPDLDAMWLVYDYMMPPTLETMASRR